MTKNLNLKFPFQSSHDEKKLLKNHQNSKIPISIKSYEEKTAENDHKIPILIKSYDEKTAENHSKISISIKSMAKKLLKITVKFYFQSSHDKNSWKLP